MKAVDDSYPTRVAIISVALICVYQLSELLNPVYVSRFVDDLHDLSHLRYVAKAQPSDGPVFSNFVVCHSLYLIFRDDFLFCDWPRVCASVRHVLVYFLVNMVLRKVMQ